MNYSFSFDHWHDLESGDGVWVEHRLRNGSSGWGSWTWTDLDSGYSHTISMGDLDVSGTPSSSTIPVFGGDAVSGWVSSSTNLSNIPILLPIRKFNSDSELLPQQLLQALQDGSLTT